MLSFPVLRSYAIRRPQLSPRSRPTSIDDGISCEAPRVGEQKHRYADDCWQDISRTPTMLHSHRQAGDSALAASVCIDRATDKRSISVFDIEFPDARPHFRKVVTDAYRLEW